MTLLHAHFNLRNQQAFQRLLDTSNDRGHTNSHSAGVSSSVGKSWSKSGTVNLTSTLDVNARDWLGRSVLHLAAASIESLEYVRLLLRHPAINVNIQDTESHWTPLHRALYHANLPAALLLLQRSEIDTSLKDLEGYTAFDLYNSTLEGTKPSSEFSEAKLYTWGINRNAALGLGDGDDRNYPDQVVIQSKDDLDNLPVRSRFAPILVRQIQMSKLHTVVVTSEPRGNLRVCGFGSGGRLGPGQHTQYSLKPLSQFPQTIVSVALGQDHTLALTSAGEVYTWGLNRFAQLGYVVESTSTAAFGRNEEPIQSTPKKVYGSLKKEFVRGVAACKSASACWTSEEVFTWGTNNGQLGYDKSAQPVQIIPRKVTKVTKPVIAISITDSAMACLLESQDVICIWNDRSFKINFPNHAFPSEIQPYRPPEALKAAHIISKITSCDDTFAALSSKGELFTFAVPTSTSDADFAQSSKAFKPQRVWALRKQFSAVKDVAIGSDGSLIICTESGHVFVRSRGSNTAGGGASSSSNKAFKFHRMPYVQRVVEVCANSTGAFGAMQVDYVPQPLVVRGNSMAEDLAGIMPFLKVSSCTEEKEGEALDVGLDGLNLDAVGEGEEEGSDASVTQDIKSLLRLCKLLVRDKEERKDKASPGVFSSRRLPHGADVMLVVPSGAAFPTHQVILAARSRVLSSVLSSEVVKDKESNIKIRFLSSSSPSSSHPRLEIAGVQPMSILVLLDYLYSDNVLAIWDNRVSNALWGHFSKVNVKPAQIKLELQALARVLELPQLSAALASAAKRPANITMVDDITDLHRSMQTSGSSHLSPASSTSKNSPLAPDVILQLADKEVYCHSAILRSRTVFFSSLFDEEEWTKKRWDENGMITVNLRNMRWHVMQYVVRFMCCGEDSEIFETLDFARSVDDVLEFMFEVMAAATELHLDRLVLLCSDTILNFLNINTACYILSEATHFNAFALVQSVRGYMAANLETLLESRILDVSAHSLIKELSYYIRQMQIEKSPIPRTNHLVEKAMLAQKDWLAMQDIPQPIVPSNPSATRKESPRLSPRVSTTAIPRQRSAIRLSLGSPVIQAQPVASRPSLANEDDVFSMDDVDPLPPLALDRPPLASSGPIPAWKSSSTPRVDMRAVMAEAASSLENVARGSPSTRHSMLSSENMHRTSPQRRSDAFLPATTPPGPSGSKTSPWKIQPARPSTMLSPGSMVESKERPAASGSPSRAPPQPAPHRPPGPQPILGPVFTPARQPSSKPSTSNLRKTSNPGKAWTSTPAPVVPSPSTTSKPGMSFVAIQHLQLEQGVTPVKDKRSLLEIQEEEQARQAEADFMIWWAAEEERVRFETESVPPPPRPSKSPRKSKKPKGKGAQERPEAPPKPNGARRAKGVVTSP